MIKPILAVFSLALSLSANAAIQSIDSAFGVDTITRDTTTGLDWLDLTATNGMSYDQVLSELATGGTLEGWRYASHDEALLLWEHIAGISTPLYGSVDVNSTPYSGLVNGALLLGNTYAEAFPGSADYGVLGVTATIWNSNSFSYPADWFREYVGFRHFTNDSSAFAYFEAGHDGLGRQTGAAHFGHYLVQASPVPVPAAFWLFGTSLLCLGGLGRKR